MITLQQASVFCHPEKWSQLFDFVKSYKEIMIYVKNANVHFF